VRRSIRCLARRVRPAEPPNRPAASPRIGTPRTENPIHARGWAWRRRYRRRLTDQLPLVYTDPSRGYRRRRLVPPPDEPTALVSIDNFAPGEVTVSWQTPRLLRDGPSSIRGCSTGRTPTCG
jgi:hypothetical protein